MTPNYEDQFFPCEPWNGLTSYLYTGWMFNLPGVTDQPDAAGYGSSDPDAAAAALIANNMTLVTSFVAGYVTGELVKGGDYTPDQLDDNVDVNQVLTDAGVGLPPTNPAVTIMRLREGIERFLITDINNPAGSAQAQSTIWIMDDWVSADAGQEFNHLPGGSNLLFMDGHVEFVKYGEKWPVNTQMAILQGKALPTALGL